MVMGVFSSVHLRTDRVAVPNNSILGSQDFYCEHRNLKEKDA